MEFTVPVGAQQFVSASRYQGDHAKDEGELRRRTSGETERHRGHDGGAGAGGAWKDSGQQLGEGAGDRDGPRDDLMSTMAFAPGLDAPDDEGAQQGGPSDWSDGLGELEVHLVQ